MSAEEYMRAAWQQAREGILAEQTPFGACIVRAGEIISGAHNTVWAATDSTAHAEILAIRAANQRLQTIDLAGCVIYTTCEPCPMCFTACHWAHLDGIVYGAAIADAADAGFRELTIPAAEMKRLGGSPIALHGGVLREENIALFAQWLAQPGRRSY